MLTIELDDAAVLNIWDSAEVSVTIIAASIPSLRVFFRDFVSSAGGKYYAQPDGGTPSNGKIVRVDEIVVKHGGVTDNEGENTFEMQRVK